MVALLKFVFIYLLLEELLFWKSYLFASDRERMPINQYLGESGIESHPAGDVTKTLLCLSDQEILKAAVYCITL